MVFEYLNNKDVWSKFCATYEGVYFRLEEFDKWYEKERQGKEASMPAIRKLKDEWKNYMEVVLKSLVIRSRSSFDSMYKRRK